MAGPSLALGLFFQKRLAFISTVCLVIGMSMAPAVALGFARFAYALLLPSMKTQLAWSYMDAGALNTANAIGYLIGALVASRIALEYGSKRVFLTSLSVTAACLIATGATDHFAFLFALRGLAGVCGAIAFVVGGGIVAATGGANTARNAPVLLAIYFSGAGIGICASALSLPHLISGTGWQAGWLALGGLSLGATLIAALAVSQLPAPTPPPSGHAAWPKLFLIPILASYFLFGSGYIVYMTFIVAFLNESFGFSNEEITIFWSILGASSIATAFIWGPALSRLKGGWGAFATIGTVTLGAALPLVFSGYTTAFASAALFGGAFLAVIAAVTSFARRNSPPHAWTAAIGALTVSFGLGQCLGPIVSGALSDLAGGVEFGLTISISLLAVAALVGIAQKEKPQI